jgi:hypothetical protein
MPAPRNDRLSSLAPHENPRPTRDASPRADGLTLTERELLALQRRAGNRAVAAMVGDRAEPVAGVAGAAAAGPPGQRLAAKISRTNEVHIKN